MFSTILTISTNKEDQVAVNGLLEGGAAVSIHCRGGWSRGTKFRAYEDAPRARSTSRQAYVVGQILSHHERASPSCASST
jgi:hypothetical protein